MTGVPIWRLIRQTAEALGTAGVEAPEREARLLAQHALAMERWRLTAERDRPIDDETAARLSALAAQRAAGTPIARMTGRKEFWSLDLALSPETLVPRPDSETAVDAGLACLPDRDADYRVLDLGTGTGALLLALLTERPNAWGVGVDRSEGAARQARANAQALGLAPRAAFAVADWGLCLDGASFDLVIANPPYVSQAEWRDLSPEVRDHDPPLALLAGADGLDAYRAIVPDLCRLLAPGGHAVLEIGAGQADKVARLATEAGLAVAGCARDLAGLDRALTLDHS